MSDITRPAGSTGTGRPPLVVVTAALAIGLVYLGVALVRIAYPYDLEFIENGMLLQALRMAHGLPAYPPPNADFVPHAYPPLYPWLGSWLLRLAGPVYWPLRTLSVAATLCTSLLLFGIGRRESRNAVAAETTAAGAAGAALFLAGNRLMGGWYELARVDSLFVALVVGGLALTVYSGRARGQVAAALALVAAFYTKQQGLVFIAAAGLYLAWAQRWRAWPFVVTAAASGGLASMGLQAATGGGFAFYAFGIQGGSSELQPVRLVLTLVMDFGGGMAGLVLLAAAAGVLAARRLGWGFILKQPWFFFMAVAVAVAVLGRTSVGGNLNHLMPAYALLCLGPALFRAEARRLDPGGRQMAMRLLGAALVIQLGLLLFNPVRYVTGQTLPLRLLPTPAMRQAGDRLIARIAAVDGEVYIPQHPAYALFAGKTPAVQISALWHARGRGREPLPPDLVARIENEHYVMIIGDESAYFETDPAWRKLLAAHYRPIEVLDPTEAPPTLSGMVVRPLTVYGPGAAGLR